MRAVTARPNLTPTLPRVEQPMGKATFTTNLLIDAHLCWAASGGAVCVLEATRHTRHAHLTCTPTTKQHENVTHRRSGTVAEAERGSGVGPCLSRVLPA
jgi:hypothetical protein